MTGKGRIEPFGSRDPNGRSWHNPAALATGQPVRLLG